MKKTILFLLGLGFLFCVPHVLAQSDFVPLAPITNFTDSGSISAIGQNGFATFFNNLYRFLIGIAAVLAVIEIIWGGLEVATNKDSASKILDGKGRIMQAILGLVLVLSPVLVFSIINPSILNLSLNLPKIDTTSNLQQPAPPPCGNGRREVGGKCVRLAPAHEGFNSEKPAGYWCFQVPPTPLGECGSDDAGNPIDCNYICATGTNGQSRCNDLYRLNCNGGQPAIPACPASFSTMPNVCTQ